MNDAWIVWTSVGLGAGLLVAFFVVVASRRRLVPVARATLVVAVFAWVVGVAAMAADVGDAGGFIDCRDSCTSVQYVAAVVFVGGPVVAVLAAMALVIGMIHLRGNADRP
jgi:hypothetical protein